MENDFSAMDKMIELGMGMAVGNQVAKSMNEMMTGLQRPPELQVTAQPLRTPQTIASGQPPEPAYRQFAISQTASQQVSKSPAAVAQVVATQGQTQQAQAAFHSETYYVSLESGKQTGPISGIELAKLVMQGKVVSETPVWKPCMESWKTAAEVSEVAELISLLPQKE